jgi:hypothetical protein
MFWTTGDSAVRPHAVYGRAERNLRVYDGEPVGYVCVEDRPDLVHLRELVLLRRFSLSRHQPKRSRTGDLMSTGSVFSSRGAGRQ